MNDYIGQVFQTNGGTDCVVIKYNGARDVQVQFLDANKHVTKTRLSHLKNGAVKNPHATREKFLGKVFPTNGGVDCKIIEYFSSHKVTVQFLDEYKFEVTCQMSHVTRGEVKNPYARTIFKRGFIGDGSFKATVKGKTTKEYLCWYNMLARVYCTTLQKNYPTYIGCSISEEWHNFQVFAKWFTEHQFYRSGYELDKDILSRGNKHYSKDTCTLVPKRINAVVNNSTNPSLIRQAAFEEVDNIEPRVFESLINWQKL